MKRSDWRANLSVPGRNGAVLLDKYAKIGFQVGELYADRETLMPRIENVCRIKNTLMEHLYHKPLLDPEEIYKEIKENAENLETVRGTYICRAAPGAEGRQEDSSGRSAGCAEGYWTMVSIRWSPLPPHWQDSVQSVRAFRRMQFRRLSVW